MLNYCTYIIDNPLLQVQTLRIIGSKWVVMTCRRTGPVSRIPFFPPIVYTLRRGTSTIGLDNANKSSVQWVHLKFTAYSWRQSFPMKTSVMIMSFEGVVRREWCKLKLLLRSFSTGKWRFHSICASWWRVDVLWRLEFLTSSWWKYWVILFISDKGSTIGCSN